MGKNTVIGYKKFKSKSGLDCCVLHVLMDLSMRDKSFGAVGRKVVDVFIPDDLHDTVTPTCVNKEVVVARGLDNEITSLEFK